MFYYESLFMFKCSTTHYISTKPSSKQTKVCRFWTDFALL